jgi:hypothetical protein
MSYRRSYDPVLYHPVGDPGRCRCGGRTLQSPVMVRLGKPGTGRHSPETVHTTAPAIGQSVTETG